MRGKERGKIQEGGTGEGMKERVRKASNVSDV